MSTGQTSMIMQMPSGAASPSGKPASSLAAIVPGGGQKSNDSFAEMLLGVSSVGSNQPVATTGAEKVGSQVVSDATEEEAATPQSDVKPDDMLAMLMAAAASGSQLSQGAPDVKGVSEESTGSKQIINDTVQQSSPADVTSGAMVALNAADSKANVNFTQDLNGNNVQVPNGVADKEVSNGQPLQQQLSNPASLEKGAMQMQPATGLQAVQQAVSQQSALQQPVPQQTAVVLNDVPLSPQQPERTSLETKSQMVAMKPETDTSVLQAATSATSDASSVTGVTPELASKPGKTSPLSDVKLTHANAAAGTLTVVDVDTVPAASEIAANKTVAAEANKEASNSPNVESSHQTFDEVALAGNQQHVGHATEKAAATTEGALKAGLVSQASTAKEGLADGSESGSNGEKFEGFMPKSAETATNVTQQITGGHQVFSTEVLTSSASQPLQADKSLPVSHEQVAGQVREQLANHDLKSGSDQITFKLSPDHLGEIKVNLSLQDQRLRVEIVAETRAARDGLLQHIDSLKESLARQNISIEKFDVTTGGGNTGNQGNNAQSEWRELAQNRQSQKWLSAGGYRTPLVETVSSLPVYQAQTSHAMVDLHF